MFKFLKKREKYPHQECKLPKSMEDILGLQRNTDVVLKSKYLREINDPLKRGINCMWDISEKIPEYSNLTADIAEDKKYRKLVYELNDARGYAAAEINEKVDCVLLCQYFLALAGRMKAFLIRIAKKSDDPVNKLMAMGLILRIETHKGFIEPTYLELMEEIRIETKTG